MSHTERRNSKHQHAAGCEVRAHASASAPLRNWHLAARPCHARISSLLDPAGEVRAATSVLRPANGHFCVLNFAPAKVESSKKRPISSSGREFGKKTA
eukprot:6198727-Pleurochrysis_carterae.AAC.1